MATGNFSGDEKQYTFLVEQLHCSPHLLFAAGTHHLIFLSVLNSFLSLAAFLGNSLILVALRKESSLHPPSKLLLRNLATTDLCVDLIAQPLSVTLWVTIINEHWNTCRYVALAVSVTSYILCVVSLLTMTAISVDRLLALLLGLRYSQVVTLKRVYLITITFFVASTASSTTRIFLNSLVASWHDMLVVLLCLVASIYSYTKIFFTLRHHQNQVQDHVQQPNQTNQLNIARYRKAVFTALWLQVMLVVCYLPYLLLVASLFHVEPSSIVSLAWTYTSTLVFLNSSLNPILYCWKIDAVKQEVKDIIRQILCFWSIQMLYN